MHTKLLVLGLVCLIQACGPVLSDTLAPEQTDSPGMLQMLREKAREAKEKVKEVLGGALTMARMYSEDHLEPLTSSYAEWASYVKTCSWETIKATIDNYMPY